MPKQDPFYVPQDVRQRAGELNTNSEVLDYLADASGDPIEAHVVRRMRHDLGLSQTELADLLHVYQPDVSKWENEDCDLKCRHIRAKLFRTFYRFDYKFDTDDDD